MLRQTATSLASLRYRRPYWMLFLKGVDNWKIYTVIQQPDHQRTEMLYQAWLGGLDRPYVRPKCMAHQPAWLSKKRHLLLKSRLEGPETPMEKYVLEWQKTFHSFQGKERPTPDDLHTAFDLVERPLDLSYACQLLHQCRNTNNIRFAEDTFIIFLEACLRVDRKDCARYAMEHAEALGFWHIDDDCRKYLSGEQTWYKRSPLDSLYYPLEENAERNASCAAAAQPTAHAEPVAAASSEDGGAEAEKDDEIARLQAELDALEGAMADAATAGNEGADGDTPPRTPPETP